MSRLLSNSFVKRAAKRVAGEVAATLTPLMRDSASRRGCVFYWHRIADLHFVDPCFDDWNTPPHVFRKQIQALAEMAEFVPLLELQKRLLEPSSSSRLLVSLTFDDVSASFFLKALSVLREFGAHATAFLVTGAIGKHGPMSHDRWADRNFDRVQPEAWRPVTRRELDRCVASGLVTLGGHSHRHLNGLICSNEELKEEAERSREILCKSYGDRHARAYSYPYGCTRLGHVPPGYIEAVKAAGYTLAVTTDLRLTTPDDDPFLLPRIEAHTVDTARIIRAKARGALAPYRLLDRFRSADRAV